MRMKVKVRDMVYVKPTQFIKTTPDHKKIENIPGVYKDSSNVYWILAPHLDLFRSLLNDWDVILTNENGQDVIILDRKKRTE